MFRERHLFIADICEITSGLWVYRTRQGPIFALCGTKQTLKKYKKDPSGRALVRFFCSHDLRKGVDYVDPNNGDMQARLIEALEIISGVKNPSFWMEEIAKTAERLKA